MRVALLVVLVALAGGCAEGSREDPSRGIGAASGREQEEEILEQIGVPAEGAAAPIVVERFERSPDFRTRARSSAFRRAVADFARESGATRVAVSGIPGALGFRVDPARVAQHLREWNRKYAERGAYVFVYEDAFGDGARDGIIVLPTRDKFEVLEAAETNGVNIEIDNGEIVAWLRRLDRTHPFVLTGAGIDFVDGYFVERVDGALPLAREMYKICPDIVDQGTGDVQTLARELEETQTLYLWWD